MRVGSIWKLTSRGPGHQQQELWRQRTEATRGGSNNSSSSRRDTNNNNSIAQVFYTGDAAGNKRGGRFTNTIVEPQSRTQSSGGRNVFLCSVPGEIRDTSPRRCGGSEQVVGLQQLHCQHHSEIFSAVGCSGFTPRHGDDARVDDHPSRFRSDRISPLSSERENADGWLGGFPHSSHGAGVGAATFRNCKSSHGGQFLPTLLNTQLPATPANIDSSVGTSTRGRGTGGEQAATSSHHRLPAVGFPDRRAGHHSGGDEGDRMNCSEPRIARLRSLEKRGYEPVFTKEIRACQQQEDDFETPSVLNHMQMTAAVNNFPHPSSTRFRDLRGETTERDSPDDAPHSNDGRYRDFQFLCVSDGERGPQGRDNFHPKEREGGSGFSAPVLMGEKAFVAAAASHSGALFPNGYARHPSEDNGISSTQTSLRDIRTGFFDNCMQTSTASATLARPPGIMKPDFLMKMVPSETRETVEGGDSLNCFSSDLPPQHMKDGCRWAAVGERPGQRERGQQQVLEGSFQHKFFLQQPPPPPPPPASNFQREVGAALSPTEQLIENRNRQRRQPQE